MGNARKQRTQNLFAAAKKAIVAEYAQNEIERFRFERLLFRVIFPDCGEVKIVL